MGNVLIAFLLPLFIILASVYWTIKVHYSKKFLPTIMLIVLAILVFIIPLLLAFFHVIGGGFSIGILSVYFSFTLLFGSLVNFIVILAIKKNKVCKMLTNSLLILLRCNYQKDNSAPQKTSCLEGRAFSISLNGLNVYFVLLTETV